MRRVEHPISGADIVTLFFHDGPGEQLAVETDGAGTAHTRYVLDSQGEPVAQEKNGARSFYVDDPRGNLTQQLDGSQNVVAVYAYDPYGKEKRNLTRTTSSNWDSRLRFQMAPRDRTTGAYNLGQRLLDPKINRFVGADSYVASAANMGLALDPLTGNRYLYAGANPAGLIDDGHAPGWMKRAARWGKGVLKNRVVRSIVVTAGVVFICGTAILCGIGVGAVIRGGWSAANYAANAKNKSWGGYARATVGGMAAGAAEGGAAAALAKAQAAAKAALAARRAAVAETVASRVAGQGYHSFSAFKRAHGAAGPGMHWHHIVEQTPRNVANFGAEAIHNTANLVRLPAGVHRQVSGYYSSIQPSFTGSQTVRQWLGTQSYEFQRQFGDDVLAQFGAIVP